MSLLLALEVSVPAITAETANRLFGIGFGLDCGLRHNSRATTTRGKAIRISRTEFPGQ
jgi:hypothetical protein